MDKSAESDIAKYWAPISASIGFVLLLLQLAQAFKGDRSLVTWLLLLVSAIAISVGMSKYAFSLSGNVKSWGPDGKPIYFHRYSWYRLATILFLSAIGFAVLSFGLVLTNLKAIPDCCGLIPITPTETATETVTATTTPSLTATFTSLPPTSTDTPVSARTATEAIVPTITKTRTSIPTSTATFTPTPDPFVYRGLERNCFDPTYWNGNVYPGEKGLVTDTNGCWDLSSRGFSAQGGELRINAKNLPYSVFSISTKLPPGDLEIHFKVRIETFSSITADNSAILIFGIGPSADWASTNGNYLLYRIPKRSDGTLIYEEIGTTKIKPDNYLVKFSPPRTFDVIFSIKGIDLTVYADGKTYTYYPVGLTKPGARDNFWIGYQLPANKSTLKATISEFTIIEK